MSTSEHVITLTNAAFGYGGETRVEDLNLQIKPGSAVALIGPNGSGKSTLLRGLLGLAELTAGSAEVLGGTPLEARKHAGFLPQSDHRENSLPLTVQQIVAMGLYRTIGAVRPLGKTGKAAVADVLHTVGLTGQARKQYGELSGGQQQRAILARALVSNPQLILLDEPFNGLDHENREALLVLVRQLQQEGRTVIVSTHDLDIAQRACTHALLLSTGHREGQAGHPAAYGPLSEALTLEAVQHAFQDATVELDDHTVTTTRETE